MLRIVFMGTPEFAATVLRAMCAAGYAPTLVVSQPDRPKGRGRKLVATPVHAAADELSLPIFQPEKLDDNAVERLRAESPGVMVVSAYGKLLRPRVFEMPEHGCLNTHASLLPQYRGAAPINWAIINGETQAGVTIMRIDKGMDTGPMSLRGAIPVEATDTAGTLTEKLAHLGGELIVEALQKLEAGELHFTPQDDTAATHAPMMNKEHGRVDWTKPAVQLDRLIRGVTPWPGAQSSLDGVGVKILEASPVSDVRGEPGTVVRADKKGVVVACGDGALSIKRLQVQGRKAVDAAAFLNGRALSPGDRFGS